MRPGKPTTLPISYRSAQQFFLWALEEGLIKTSPMANMRPPRIPDTPRDVIRDEDLVRLLKVVDADRTFAGRRDAAIIRLFFASGARLAEVTNPRWTPRERTTNDIDLDGSLIRVVGRGNRERPVCVGAKAAKVGQQLHLQSRRAKHMADAPWL